MEGVRNLMEELSWLFERQDRWLWLDSYPLQSTRCQGHRPLCKHTHQGNLDPGLGNGMCPPAVDQRGLKL